MPLITEVIDKPEFRERFKGMFASVVTVEFPDLEDFDLYPGDSDDYKTDYSNAISETLRLLGTDEEETGPWLGDLYDLADEVCPWPEELDEEEA
jgi:hypothetical protein